MFTPGHLFFVSLMSLQVSSSRSVAPWCWDERQLRGRFLNADTLLRGPVHI